TADTGNGERFRAVREEDATCFVSGRDGAGGAVGPIVQVDCAALSESRQRAAPGGAGADAARVLSPAMVQSVRPGVGRGAVRLGRDAAICGHRSGAEPVPDET